MANVEYPRDGKSVRCGCDAKLYLTKEIIDGATQWYVSQFSNGHNHELLEDDQVLELEKGLHPGHLSFIEKDVRNFIRTCKKAVPESDALLSEKRETDTMELLGACKAMAEKDTDFVYDYATDENKKVVSIAWSNGDSVRTYEHYGDVVVLDTSYRSIAYDLLLGVWFGMDNHGKPTFLGCVLLQDESSHPLVYRFVNSYSCDLSMLSACHQILFTICFFEQCFVGLMRGKHPETILTDMDSGLRDAVLRELPNTKHVFYLSHVLSKLSTWFSSPLGLQYEDFRAEFDILCHLQNVGDFEHQWHLLVSRFGLVSDKHIALLFSYRGSRSMSYIRGCFLARTMTPEFSRSMDEFLKRILSGQTSLRIFFEQVAFTASLENQSKGGMQYMHIKTCMPIEEHARSILTPFAFNALQQEIVLSMEYEIQEMLDGSFLVRHFKKMEGECLVFWMQEDEQIHCSCKEFERSGILCRHCLRLLVVKNYFQIPEKYFPLRWQDDHLLAHVNHQNAESNSDHCAQAFHSLAATLLTESMYSKERFTYGQGELAALVERIRTMPLKEELFGC